MKNFATTLLVAASATFPLLTNAWTLSACGQVYSGTQSSSCTILVCEAGELLNFDAGPVSEGPVELNIFADFCTDEIDHTPYNWTDYVLERDMYSFLLLT